MSTSPTLLPFLCLSLLLITLEKMVVSVLHKELEYKVEKFKYRKVGGHAAEDQNQI